MEIKVNWTESEKLMWKPEEDCTREELIGKIKILEDVLSGYRKRLSQIEFRFRNIDREISNDASEKRKIR